MRSWFKLLAGTAFLGAAAIAITLVAAVFARAQEREVVYRHLEDALTPVADAASRVQWRAPVRPLVREFVTADERLIGKALSNAWRHHAAAMASGEVAPLEDHFSGTGLLRARQSVQQGYKQKTQMVVLKQVQSPSFYHLDGSIMQVTGSADVVRFAAADDRLAHFELTEDQTVTTLSNETTGWRILSHERRAASPIEIGSTPRLPYGRLAGINYYPADAPWSLFWPNFDPAQADADLSAITDLGANAVRIFLPAKAFTDPDAVIQRKGLAKLETFLFLARHHGVQVVPTLFDMKPGYTPATWADDLTYLEAVLPVLQASEAVAYVDLKNEPDLDMAHHGQPLIEAWLRTMLTMTRSLAPDLPLTIGWSTAQAAELLIPDLDLVSYHDYAPTAGAADRLNRLRKLAAGKPVHVTEIGESSFSLVGAFPGSDVTQARALSKRLEALEAADGLFVWTLHDFEEPDRKAVGSSPWVLGLQSRFGLIDPKGQRKPAHRAVAKYFRSWAREDTSKVTSPSTGTASQYE